VLPTIRNVVSVGNKAIGTCPRVIIGKKTAWTSGILLVACAADLTPLFVWLGVIIDAGACAVCDVQGSALRAFASVGAASMLSIHSN
jgi:hypothetical protein